MRALAARPHRLSAASLAARPAPLPPMRRSPSRRRAPCPPLSATAFRPSIDIHKGIVKQIVGGSLRDLDG